MNIRGEVQNWLIANINNIASITLDSEDGSSKATMQDLMNAIEMADSDDLKCLMKHHSIIYYNDGYLNVRIRRRAR